MLKLTGQKEAWSDRSRRVADESRPLIRKVNSKRGLDWHSLSLLLWCCGWLVLLASRKEVGHIDADCASSSCPNAEPVLCRLSGLVDGWLP